jgi:hypothetical protein
VLLLVRQADRAQIIDKVDAGQVAVEWLDPRTLPARRFYPVTLRLLLAAEDPVGPVYLGDAD